MSEPTHLRLVTASPSQDKPTSTGTADRVLPSAEPLSADQAPEPPAPASQTPPAASAPPRPGRDELDTLVRAALALFVIGFSLWLGIAWTGYANRFAQTGENWHIGSKPVIELTLIREDKQNLACASDVQADGLHCMYRADGRQLAPGSQEDAQLLRPYNTVKNEPLLAAGLWSSPVMEKQLPAHRFTVVCRYEITDIMRSVSLRWSPTGPFEPSKHRLPVGKLLDCVIPQ